MIQDAGAGNLSQHRVSTLQSAEMTPYSRWPHYRYYRSPGNL